MNISSTLPRQSVNQFHDLDLMIQNENTSFESMSESIVRELQSNDTLNKRISLIKKDQTQTLIISFPSPINSTEFGLALFNYLIDNGLVLKDLKLKFINCRFNNEAFNTLIRSSSLFENPIEFENCDLNLDQLIFLKELLSSDDLPKKKIGINCQAFNADQLNIIKKIFLENWLEELRLENNSIDDSQLELITATFNKRIHLQLISLCNNNISDKAAFNFIKICMKHSAKLDIVLDGNNLTDDFVTMLSQFMNENYLENEFQISVRNTKISSEKEKELKNILKRKPPKKRIKREPASFITVFYDKTLEAFQITDEYAQGFDYIKNQNLDNTAQYDTDAAFEFFLFKIFAFKRIKANSDSLFSAFIERFMINDKDKFMHVIENYLNKYKAAFKFDLDTYKRQTPSEKIASLRKIMAHFILEKKDFFSNFIKGGNDQDVLKRYCNILLESRDPALISLIEIEALRKLFADSDYSLRIVLFDLFHQEENEKMTAKFEGENSIINEKIVLPCDIDDTLLKPEDGKMTVYLYRRKDCSYDLLELLDNCEL